MKKIFIVQLLLLAISMASCSNSTTKQDIIDLCTMTISIDGKVNVNKVESENIIPDLLADSTIAEAVLVSTTTVNPEEVKILQVKGSGIMKTNLPNEKFRWERQYYIMTAINEKGEISFYPVGDESSALDSLIVDPNVRYLLVSYLTNTGKIGIFSAKGKNGDVFEEQIN